MKNKTVKQELINKATLKEEFGWTEKLIKDFLPTPISKKNPMYACAAPMQLWPVEVVAEVMKTQEFINAMEKLKERRAKREKKAEEKARKKQEEINEVIHGIQDRIQVYPIEIEDVRALAIQSQQDLYESREKYDMNALNCTNERVIKRWMVNYLRHDCSNYEELLEELQHSVAADNKDAYLMLKNSFLDAIAKMYPELSEECYAQSERTCTRICTEDCMRDMIVDAFRAPHVEALKALL